MIEITHNVCNIRYSKNNNWIGQTGSYKGFCVFHNQTYSIRACYVLLVNYIKQGYDTVGKIITRFAPPSENNTEAYIKYVMKNVIIGRHESIYLKQGYISFEIIRMIRAMAKMETNTELNLDDIWESIQIEDRQ